MTAGSGVPDTQTPLITDEDVTKARLGAYGCAWDNAHERGEWQAGLEAVAPALRARWVAEELEEIADRAFAVTDAGRRVDAPLSPDRLRVLAAEYRNGER